MKMEKPDATTNKDVDGQAALQMMAKMQQDAEENVQKEEFNSSVNSPSTMYQNRKVDNANYWEIKDLPTKNRLYPPNTMIEARPLKVIEVKKLASINESNADYVINDIIKRTVRVTGISDVGELYLADKLYIIFWLRGVTYRDSSYTIEFKCPKCNKKSNYHFEIKNLNVNYLPDDYDPNEKIELESGDGIKLQHLKIKDEKNIERFVEINEKTLGEIDTELLALACMITEINGNEKITLSEKYNYVLDFTPRDLSYITTYIDKYGVGIEPNMNVECAECGGVVPMGITFRSDFFLPKCKLR